MVTVSTFKKFLGTEFVKGTTGGHKVTTVVVAEVGKVLSTKEQKNWTTKKSTTLLFKAYNSSDNSVAVGTLTKKYSLQKL